MEEGLLQDITIYHKEEDKTVTIINKEASVRNTSILNHNKNGKNSVENVIVRIFDITGFKSEWNVSKDDIIVNQKVEDVIEKNIYTTLVEKYGRENVFQVKEINVNIFKDEDLKELNHIKLGCE